jgi:Mor family transcriptional regulator
MPVADPAYLVDLLGPSAVTALVKAFGGLVLDVPKRQDGQAYQRIEEVTGPAAAAKLVEKFGGTPVYIAKLYAASLAARNRHIRAAYDARVSVAELARQHQLTERQIWNILGRGEDPGIPGQANLF